MEGLAKRAVAVFVLFFLVSTDLARTHLGPGWQEWIATLLATFFLWYSTRVVHLGFRGTIRYLFQ